MNVKQVLHAYWKVGLSFLFGLAVALFWALPYVSALSFQEQYQLFLWTPAYFLQRLSVPGGLADYVAEFLTQFYYVPVVGAIILGLLLFALQRVGWRVASQCGAKWLWYPLSFVPAFALWAYMGDQNVMLSFVVSLLVAELLMWAYLYIDRRRGKCVFLALSIPLGYWLFGANILCFSVFVVAYEVLRNRELKTFLQNVVVLFYALFVIYGCSWCVAYSFGRLLLGINYYRFPVYSPIMQLLVMTLVAFVPLLLTLLPAFKKSFLVVVETAVVALAGSLLLKMSYDAQTYELIDNDFWVRTQQWNKIVSHAEKHPATTPMGVSIVNLALSQQGQLADRLFDFYQNGGEGLFPTYSRDMTSPIPTAETFYRLGMVNEALRYCFEAQEAIPNFRKSGRLTQRIIDCEIINGHYGVARKLLHLIKNALFYRSWAERRLAMLGNEHAVNADPVYGRLRQYRQKKHDFLFSDQEMDQMLGLLFASNKKNKMAYEYLVCYELLQRDLSRFMEYYPLGRYVDYDHIPRSFQEILVGTWLKTHADPRTIPYSVDQSVVNNTIDFLRTYSANAKDPALSQPPYVNNAWYYMLLSGTGTERKGKEKMKTIY